MTENPAYCRNCNSVLSGEYCSQCGQREGRGDLGLADVAGEMFGEIFSFDSRLWRTLLSLVFRPGFLSSEFNIGHRARYVPPFRLYLIISFVLFLVLSLLANNTSVIRTGDTFTLTTSAVEETVPGQPASTSSVTIESGTEDEAEFSPVVIDGEEAGVRFDISLADEDSPAWLQELDQKVEENARKYSEDPAEFVQLLAEYLPQMMFLLLPVFALLLRICYLFSPFHYLQHLVFSLHFYSFGYLLYLFRTVVSTWLYEDGIGNFLLLVFALYLLRALMRTYGSGVAGAIGKTLFILVADGFFLLMGFIAVSLIALAVL